jgi:hypothetical protein
MTTFRKQRVIIDCQPSGFFGVYADPEVEVICRSAHLPDDELYRYGHKPIAEEWLIGKPVGFRGDGSEAEERAEEAAEVLLTAGLA